MHHNKYVLLSKSSPDSNNFFARVRDWQLFLNTESGSNPYAQSTSTFGKHNVLPYTILIIFIGTSCHIPCIGLSLYRFARIHEYHYAFRPNYCFMVYFSQTVLSVTCSTLSNLSNVAGRLISSMPSNTAVMPFRPSMPAPIITLTSSISPASRKAPLICPPPVMARRFTRSDSPDIP